MRAAPLLATDVLVHAAPHAADAALLHLFGPHRALQILPVKIDELLFQRGDIGVLDVSVEGLCGRTEVLSDVSPRSAPIEDLSQRRGDAAPRLARRGWIAVVASGTSLFSRGSRLRAVRAHDLGCDRSRRRRPRR